MQSFEDFLQRLSEKLPAGAEKHSYLQQLWEQEKMQSLKDIWRLYNSKNVVQTLEAMQKMVLFYHDTGVDMLNFVCTLANVADISLRTSFSAKLYPFTEIDKNFLWKVREDMVGGPPIVCTRKNLATKLISASPKMFANRFLDQMLAKITLTQYVNLRLQDSTKDTSLMQICNPSSVVKTNIEVSKIWSCDTSNERVRIVDLRAST